MDSAIRCTGKPEVLVVTIAPGLRNCATRKSKFLFISRFSATTSMIQSASAHRARSSSKFPMETFSTSAGVKNAAGFDFFAASKPRTHNLIAVTGRCSRLQIRRNDVQQNARQPGVGQMRGDTRTHGARAQHGCLLDATFHGVPFPEPALEIETSGQVTKPPSPGQTNYGPATKPALK